MEHSIKIAAVVVTFNRKELLIECLDGILASSRALDAIFVIDNASTDGTEALITKTYGAHPSIRYIRLDHNTGSAGGFHHGVKAAYDWGAEWIWFLDDDVCPQETCLETMLSYSSVSKCIHPSKRDLNGKEFIWEAIFDPALGRTTFLKNVSFKHGKDFTFVNIGCFEGMCIHREVIDHIGYPDPRFFIVGDDMLYGFKASLYTNVIYVRDAYLLKLVPMTQKISPTFLYYAVRNQFLIKEYLAKEGILNKPLFYGYNTFFFLYLAIVYTIKDFSFSAPYSIIKGILDGARHRFYKMHYHGTITK